MEEPSPVAKHTEPSQKDLGTFDERWDRYCRLRDTACQLFIYGQFDSAPQAAGAGLPHTFSSPEAAGNDSQQTLGLIEPQADSWLVSCEADMASAVECTAAIDTIPRATPPADEKPAATAAENEPAQKAADAATSKSDA